jgi:hypothetical protein
METKDSVPYMLGSLDAKLTAYGISVESLRQELKDHMREEEESIAKHDNQIGAIQAKLNSVKWWIIGATVSYILVTRGLDDAISLLLS